MGGNIIPMLVERGEAKVYDFRDNDVPGTTDRDRGYWRDVGTLDSFYDAHMDLIAVHPVFNLYNNDWPIYTDHDAVAAGEVRARLAASGSGRAVDSMVSPGAVISGVAGGELGRLARRCGCTPGRTSTGSVLMDGVDVGRHAVVRNAIIDKNVVDPGGRRDRRRPRTGPASASPSPTAASWSSARARRSNRDRVIPGRTAAPGRTRAGIHPGTVRPGALRRGGGRDVVAQARPVVLRHGATHDLDLVQRLPAVAPDDVPALGWPR